MVRWLGGFWLQDDGQDLVEYSLLLCFVVVLLMSLMNWAQDPIQGIWFGVTTTTNSANSMAAGQD